MQTPGPSGGVGGGRMESRNPITCLAGGVAALKMRQDRLRQVVTRPAS
jgi:hypothetical protein